MATSKKTATKTGKLGKPKKPKAATDKPLYNVVLSHVTPVVRVEMSASKVESKEEAIEKISSDMSKISTRFGVGEVEVSCTGDMLHIEIFGKGRTMTVVNVKISEKNIKDNMKSDGFVVK